MRKINEYFNCINSDDTKEAEQQRMDGIREFVGKIFGMDIQYVAHINTLVIRDAVNAVDGVTVNVESRDPRGVLDASIDWMCTQQGLTAEQQQQRCPTGHYIDFKNGPVEMDGDKAQAAIEQAMSALDAEGAEMSVTSAEVFASKRAPAIPTHVLPRRS